MTDVRRDEPVPGADVVRLYQNPRGMDQVLITVWADGTWEVAKRPASWAVWGPPMRLVSEAR